jgi:hypothetical protein
MGKYWRMDYRFADKRRTLALGVYPVVSLAKARRRRDEARELLADGGDPAKAKRDAKRAAADSVANTFEAVARRWLEKTAANRAVSTQEKNTAWLEKNISPYLGPQPISTVTARDVLVTLQKIEARGAVESAHKIKQLCGCDRYAPRHAWAGGVGSDCTGGRSL